MGLTMGSMMFYGGMIGAGLTLVGAIITGIILGKSRMRLKAKLDKEYGKVQGAARHE